MSSSISLEMRKRCTAESRACCGASWSISTSAVSLGAPQRSTTGLRGRYTRLSRTCAIGRLAWTSCSRPCQPLAGRNPSARSSGGNTPLPCFRSDVGARSRSTSSTWTWGLVAPTGPRISLSVPCLDSSQACQIAPIAETSWPGSSVEHRPPSLSAGDESPVDVRQLTTAPSVGLAFPDRRCTGCGRRTQPAEVGRRRAWAIIRDVSSEPRMARLSDIPAIRHCYLRSWRAAYDGYLSPDVVDEEAEKRREFDWGRGIKADTSIVLVSVGDDGAVVGVVQVDEDLPPPRDRPEVVMLYLDPEAWGTQVARELLAAGLHWAADRGHSEVRLRVVEVHRRARRFYEREGWQVALDLDADRNDFFRLIYYHRTLTP